MDIATLWNTALSAGDWAVSGADLQSGSDLATAVLISFFTDRRATADEIAALGLEDPGGWWGDTGETYPIGSRLWLRRRAKATPQTLKDVQDDLVEALQWMIDDGVVSRVEVTTEWVNQPGVQTTFLGAQVVLHRGGGQPIALQYQWAWQGVS